MKAFEGKGSSLSAPGEMSRRLKGRETRSGKSVVDFVAGGPRVSSCSMVRCGGRDKDVSEITEGKCTARRKNGVKDRTLGYSHILNLMRAWRTNKVESQRDQGGRGNVGRLSPLSDQSQEQSGVSLREWLPPQRARLGALEFTWRLRPQTELLDLAVLGSLSEKAISIMQ